MSTRCYIGKIISEKPYNNYAHIYCHYNGFPQIIGKKLLKYWNTENKIDKLLNFGNISNLKQYPYVEERNETYNVNYNANDDEPFRISTLTSSMGDLNMDYVYYYDRGIWSVYYVNEEVAMPLHLAIGLKSKNTKPKSNKKTNFVNKLENSMRKMI